jgi:hypothetical protein
MKLKIKHTISLFTVLPLCLSLLTACGQGGEEPTPTPGPGAGFMPDEPFGITYASHYGRAPLSAEMMIRVAQIFAPLGSQISGGHCA